MPRKTQSKKVVKPSAYGMAGAMINLRDLMKKEHNIDVEVQVSIHGWAYPSYLGKVAVQDMARNGGPDWETYSNSFPAEHGHRAFETFNLAGTSPNNGLKLVIFTGKSGKKRKRVKVNSKNSAASEAALWIVELARELYGVEADVSVEAKVEVDRKYWTIQCKNSHITLDGARDILAEVKRGTTWTQTDRRDEFYSRVDYIRHQLHGEGIEFTIRVEVEKTASEEVI